ncbi:MAG TPA: hypothetical protein VGG11_22825 [Xanthobacteraceae bacterium]
MSAAPTAHAKPGVAPDTESAVAFLQHFAPAGPWLLSAKNPHGQDFVSKSFDPCDTREAAAWINNWQGKRNLYFSANRPRTGVNSKAKKTDIDAMLTLHVDVDPRAGSDLTEEQERILSILRAHNPAPTVIVFSGGGFQAFWLLREPAPVDDPARLEAYNKQLAASLGADYCHNIDRVMRLPGTINIPDKEKAKKGRTCALAHVIEANWDQRYALDDFPVPVGAITDTAISEPTDPFPLLESFAAVLHADVPEGERSEHCFRIIRTLVEHNYDNESITNAILTCPAGKHYNGNRKQALQDVQRSLHKGDGDVRIGLRTSGAQPWPDPLHEDAFYGLAGEVVRAIEPHSEADPAALLVQFLVACGNCAGRNIYYAVEGDRHYTNLYAVLVGKTSKARKGTSWGRVREMFLALEDPWISERTNSGLSSGEGLIWEVRDPIVKTEKDKGTGELVQKTVDEGVYDKRLLVQESEFAGTLRVMMRDGSTLSRIIRDGWDRGDLASMTKNSPARATGAHISIVGHITAEELKRYLDVTEMANGFANRFIFICAERSKILPFGGSRTEEMVRVGRKLRDWFEQDRTERELRWSINAGNLWADVYGDLSDAQPGMLGAITARAEAQVVRLALTYAVIDNAKAIEVEHLRAALAVWRYSEASAAYIFGASLGDPIADTVVAALRSADPRGMTRTELSNLFGGHKSSAALDRALALLAEKRLATTESRRDTGGRPTTVWRLRR